MISILLNGEPKKLEDQSLGRLLETLKLDGRFFAIAINREVIPKSQFFETPLKDGDEIEIVQAVGGG